MTVQDKAAQFLADGYELAAIVEFNPAPGDPCMCVRAFDGSTFQYIGEPLLSDDLLTDADQFKKLIDRHGLKLIDGEFDSGPDGFTGELTVK